MFIAITVLILYKLLSAEAELESAVIEGEQSQGWGSWVWSIVPQILAEEEEEEEGEYGGSLQSHNPPVLAVALYCHQLSITFKV
jgi:hypothetical protein